MHNIHLSNGIEMPVLGFGTYLIKPEDCAQAVEQALACGYRLIDTAQAYFNEAETGAGLVKSGVPRSQLFITTKVWISNAGEKQAMQSIEESLRRLQTDYIDLLLIHQPFGDVYGTYRALEQALSQGKVRAVGLSNFLNGRFIDMAEHFEVKPQVLQAETHVYNQQRGMRAVLKDYGTALMAWGPLAQGRPELFAEPLLQDIGARHGLSAAQTALAFLTSQGICAIPKTLHKERLEQNLQAADVTLSAEEITALTVLDHKYPPAAADFNDPELTRFLLSYSDKFKPA